MRNTVICGLIGVIIGVVVGVFVVAPPFYRVEEARSGAVASGLANTVTIGTGGVTGVYYPAGGALCLLVNRSRAAHGVRCTVESTGGSLDNLRALRAGTIELGIVQSDWQHHAFQGTSLFAGQEAFKDLRAVFSLHSEPFTVVARADAGIKTFADLKGKRVNIGNPGSGQRGTMEVLMKAMGWTRDVFAQVTELKSADQASALCAGQFDAMVFTVGHPSASIKEATSSCDSDIVEVSGPVVDKLIHDNDYYQQAVIPGGMYRGNPHDISTFGVSATVVSSASVPADTIYAIVKSVFESLDTFKSLHPALKELSKAKMVKSGLNAPLHEGALRYYQEAGLR